MSEHKHIHSHRALIGFDKHGIPTIVAKADHQEELDNDPNSFVRDYMNAVSEYKKTFPSKQNVIDQTHQLLFKYCNQPYENNDDQNQFYRSQRVFFLHKSL